MFRYERQKALAVALGSFVIRFPESEVFTRKKYRREKGRRRTRPYKRPAPGSLARE